MVISNLVLTQQIYSEETIGAHTHNRDRVPLNYSLVQGFCPLKIKITGTVVNALSSHQCGPGSNPGIDAIRQSSLWLVLSLVLRGVSLDTKELLSAFLWVACVASVSIWFWSKGRPRNGILSFGCAR